VPPLIDTAQRRARLVARHLLVPATRMVDAVLWRWRWSHWT
jgi:hypothetical protein